MALRDEVIAAVDVEIYRKIEVELEIIIADAAKRGLAPADPERMSAEYRAFRFQALAAWRSTIIDKTMWSLSGSRGVAISAKVH